MKTWADWPAALLVALGPGLPAEQDAEPVADMEFLEYLGSWDESDDEWLLFERAGEDEAGDDTDEIDDTDEPEETDDET